MLDIKGKDQPAQTCGDIIEASAPEYIKSMEEAVESGLKKFSSPFYVLVLSNKEFWTDNVVRNRFIARQTPPHASDMMRGYANYTKTLYAVNADKGEVKLAWTLPGWLDCQLIAKHPQIYSPELVRWIQLWGDGKLDLDNYDYLFK